MEAIRLDGFLLSFTPKEFEQIKRRLAVRGYPEDSDGLKKLVLDIMDREEGPEYRIGGMIGKFLETNPETVAVGLGILGKKLSGLRYRRRK